MNPQQRFYLDALGIQLYERRDAAPSAAGAETVEAEPQVVEAPAVTAPAAESKPAEARGGSIRAETQLPPVDDAIPNWLDEAPPLEEPLFGLDEPELDEADFADAAAPALPAIATLDWPALQQRVSECTACPELAANRSQTVFGIGNREADWMIIGEAPGADEDKQGEPFVGRAGQLLNAMLNAVGLKREQVYIANVLKCRPPNNRDPRPEEAAACEAFLKRQIALVQPKVILVVGRIAAQNLLKVETPIGKLRGSVHRYDGTIPLVVTYHPAYLLRSPSEKRKSWADLCLARSLLEGE
jgi:uracil-DNA glycosylase family 4